MSENPASVDFAFIDSGTGGIPYINRLLEKRKNASCIYVGDTINFPYGEKTHEQIVECVVSLCKRLIEKFSPKVIILACGTMSVNALEKVRLVFPDTLFVGTVPAIKTAASVSTKRKIGLLATNSTVKHPYNRQLVEQFAPDCELIVRGDPELISFIEHKSFTATEQQKLEAVKPAVEFFKGKDCDAIILGCTHFVNVAEEFKTVCGPEISVVDSCDGVVNRSLSLVKENPLAAEKKARLYVTGFTGDKDIEEYNVICNSSKLEWKGIL